MTVQFTERTPGSFVEERAASVVWRFWTGPPGSAVSTNGSNSPTCSPDPSSITPTTTFLSNYSDRTWASRQAAEAQNHIFDSLGERYGLRIIPGQNSFLVLPNNISRSTAVGAIMHPGGPACSPRGGGSGVGENEYDSQLGSVSTGRGVAGSDSTLVLAIGGDEKLLRRLNELESVESVSTSRKGTDAKWKLDPREVLGALETLAGVR